MLDFRQRLFLTLATAVLLWVAPALAHEVETPAEPTTQLTAQERAWLADHKVIRIAPDPDFPPIEWIDADGQFKGLAADFVALMEAELGIRFRVEKRGSWSEVLEGVRNKEIDVLSAVSASEQRRQYLMFTRPHIILPGMIFVRDDYEGRLAIDQLRGKRIAVVSQYVWQDYLESDYPDITLTTAPNVAEGLKMVSFGRTDAMVGDLATATYYIQKEGITNLRTAGETGYYTYLSFGVRKDWPELVVILEKALAGIEPGVSRDIVNRYIALKQTSVFQTRKFWMVLLLGLGAMTFLFGVVVFWNRSLKRQVGHQTEQLRIELQERKRAEERYRDLFDNAEEMIQRVSPEGRFEQVNQKWLTTLGYKRREIGDLTLQDVIHPDHWSECCSTMERLFAGETIGSIETVFVTKDGSPVFVEGNINCQFLDGNPVATRGIFRDIGDRKRAEAKRLELEAQLQRARKMEAIGTLAGGVAHDLNNILSGIVSYPDLLLMQLPDNSPLKEPIETVKDSGLKAAAIVQDLLTLARRGVAEKAVVNLNTVVDTYFQSPEFRKLEDLHPRVRIRYRLAADLLNITGSTHHLAKTVMNLVSNAVEAIQDTGEVVLSTENRYVDSAAQGYDTVEEGDYAVLSISDTGVGIPAKDRERIFEPFFTKKVMGRSGTGLGMAVVWGAVKDHDGYIDVESEEGKGTTITLFFPVTRKPVHDAQPPVSVTDYRGKGESVLVVDDVESQRDIACRILTELGYTAAAVASGEEAVAHLETAEVDLLLLDMIMPPGIDGLETYRRILNRHPRQRAIIASGYSETGRVKTALQLGAGAYLKKPYTLEGLGLAVRAELDRRSS